VHKIAAGIIRLAMAQRSRIQCENR